MKSKEQKERSCGGYVDQRSAMKKPVAPRKKTTLACFGSQNVHSFSMLGVSISLELVFLSFGRARLAPRGRQWYWPSLSSSRNLRLSCIVPAVEQALVNVWPALYCFSVGVRARPPASSLLTPSLSNVCVRTSTPSAPPAGGSCDC